MKEAIVINILYAITPRFLAYYLDFREMYVLSEVDPDGEPITEIYLGNEIISLETVFFSWRLAGVPVQDMMR
jgi:hypothetical protein